MGGGSPRPSNTYSILTYTVPPHDWFYFDDALQATRILHTPDPPHARCHPAHAPLPTFVHTHPPVDARKAQPATSGASFTMPLSRHATPTPTPSTEVYTRRMTFEVLPSAFGPHHRQQKKHGGLTQNPQPSVCPLATRPVPRSPPHQYLLHRRQKNTRRRGSHLVCVWC
jgi:hypothetical protein